MKLFINKYHNLCRIKILQNCFWSCNQWFHRVTNIKYFALTMKN